MYKSMCIIDHTGAGGTDLLSSQKSVGSSTVGSPYMWFLILVFSQPKVV